MKPVRFALISASSIAPRFLAALRESGEGEAVALYSRGEQKARDTAAAWDVPFACSDLRQLWERPDVDAVYISSVNGAHFEHAKAALEAGKHVLCEKPCTVSSEHTRRLFALARKQGLLLMEAQKMLFLPAVEQAKALIDGGALGQVLSFEASHSFLPSYNDWMFDPALSGLGGGPMASSGIYAVELLLFLFGRIEAIRGEFIRDENERVRAYVLSGTCGDGVSFTLRNSTLEPLDNCARIVAEKGTLELDEYWKARSLRLTGPQTQELSYPCTHELIYEIRHFIRCLRQGLTESPVMTEALSVAGIRALEQAVSCNNPL